MLTEESAPQLTMPHARPAGLSPGLRLGLAAIGTGVLYNLSSWLVPQLEQGAIERFGLTAAQAGLIPTSENLLAGLVSIVLARFGPTRGLRTLSLVVMVLWFTANAATGRASTVGALAICRLLSGVGTGVLTYICSTLATATARPDRTYSQLMGAGNAFAALLAASFAWISPGASTLGIFPYAALLAIAWIPLVLLQPARIERVRSTEVSKGSARGLSIFAVVIGLNLLFIMNVSNFTFSIPLGVRAHMTEAEVQVSLGVATFVGMLGALSASLVPRRAGHVVPLIVALSAALVANYIVTTTDSPLAYRVAIAASQCFAMFTFPLFLGWSVELDPSGRTAALMNGLTIVTGALCPAVAGSLVDHFSLSSLTFETLLAGGGAIACVALVGGRSHYQKSSRPAGA